MIKEIMGGEEIRTRFSAKYFDLKDDDTITKITIEYEPFSWINYYKNEIKKVTDYQRGCELRIKLLELGIEIYKIDGKNIPELE